MKIELCIIHKLLKKLASSLTAIIFLWTSLLVPSTGFAQSLGSSLSVLNLPQPGTMLSTTTSFNPVMIKGVSIYSDNPLKFDFILDSGEEQLSEASLKKESEKLIKYFLASLTIQENEMWVNLSPYEKNRIIPNDFGKTEMGRDLLAQDYMLKQLTASLMYPENKLGNEFWERVYKRAQEEYGTTDIPMNTFNKVWIIPDQANVFVSAQKIEKKNNVFIVNAHLKVMLEEDYVALDKNNNSATSQSEANGTSTEIHYALGVKKSDLKQVSGVSSQVIREIILPEIEREVNEGKTFVQLRQIYNALILATWYKKNLKKSLLGQMYVDQAKTNGVDNTDPEINQKIYDQYLEAFKKGAYDLVKEDYDPVSQEVISRKYFSGGVDYAALGEKLTETQPDDKTRRDALKIFGGFTALLAGVTLVPSSAAALTKLSTPDVDEKPKIDLSRSQSSQQSNNPFEGKVFLNKQEIDNTLKRSISDVVQRHNEKASRQTPISIWDLPKVQGWKKDEALERELTALAGKPGLHVIGEYDDSKSTIVFVHGMTPPWLIRFIAGAPSNIGTPFDFLYWVQEYKKEFNIVVFDSFYKTELKNPAKELNDALKKFKDARKPKNLAVIGWSFGALVLTKALNDDNTGLYRDIDVDPSAYTGGVSPFEGFEQYKLIFPESFESDPISQGQIDRNSEKGLARLNSKARTFSILNYEGDFLEPNEDSNQIHKDNYKRIIEDDDTIVLKPLSNSPHLEPIFSEPLMQIVRLRIQAREAEEKLNQLINPSINPTSTPTPKSIQSPDSAVTATAEEKPANTGGIDFNPANLKLNSEGQAMDMNIPEEFRYLQNGTIDGFRPVINTITPLTNLPLLLGESKENEKDSPSLSKI